MMEAAKRAKIMKEHLPDGMATDILSRLPSKSLCRFRCVSKQWCNLISDPKFVKLYNDKSRETKPPFLVFYDRDPREDHDEDECCCPPCMEMMGPIQPTTYCLVKTDGDDGRVCDKLDLNDLQGYGDFKVFSSGRELVCLRRKGDNKKNIVYICNPSTHEIVKLPSPCCSGMRKDGFALTFVPSTNEYKLVFMVHHQYEEYGPFETSTQVFDIRPDRKTGGASHSWRWTNTGDNEFPMFSCRRNPWLLDAVENVDGAIFWWMRPEKISRSCTEETFEKIISLDMEKEEEYVIVDKPKELCSLRFSNLVSLVGLKGQLSLTHVQVGAATPVIDIWMLKDAKKSIWTKEYSIELPVKNLYHALPLHVDETNVLLKLLFYNRRELVLRNYTMERKTLGNQSDIRADYRTGPYIYSDGLFPLGRLLS